MATIESERLTLPPLENGDTLTWPEFERRYDAMPELKRAELLRGVVYVASPTSYALHGDQHLDMATWLGFYKLSTPGVGGADNATDRLDERNAPQPDLLLRIVEACGGRTRLDRKGYLHGGPELVAEAASSSASYDLGIKKDVYLEHGVAEYVVWRVFDKAIDWFVLDEREYRPLEPAGGLLRSRVFPGLWLDGKAMLKADGKRVMEVLGQGLASPEHAAFVEELARRRT